MVWIDALRAWRWKIRGHQRRPVRSDLSEAVRGTRVLEIGGPSGVFGGDGPCPVYPAAGAVDRVQWSADTAWHDRQDEGVYSVDGIVRGRLHVIDDVTLARGVQVRVLEVRRPHDIYVLGRFAAGRPDDARWLDPRHPALRSSPFPIDRSVSS